MKDYSLTLDDGEEDDDDEEEEADVEEDPEALVLVAVGRLDLVADAAAGAHALVEVEDEAGEHVVALLVDDLLLLRDVELAEEVEGHHGVDVYDDGEQHDGENELLAVVRDGLQDDPEGGHAEGYVEQVGGEEEVVEVAQQGEDEVPQLVLEWLEMVRFTCRC